MTRVAGSPSQYSQQIVARHVGLVADADERRQPELTLGRELENREAERAALRRQRRRARLGGKIGENDALSRTAALALSRPMQLGPTMRMP